MFNVLFKSLSPGLAPLKGEGSLAPLRDSSPGRSLGGSLGASTGSLGGSTLGRGPLGGGSLGGGSLGGGSLGGGSLGGGSLGGTSLGGSLGKNPLGGGSSNGLRTSGRFSGAERHMDPFKQAPLGGVKDSLGVSSRLSIFSPFFFCQKMLTLFIQPVLKLSIMKVNSLSHNWLEKLGFHCYM